MAAGVNGSDGPEDGEQLTVPDTSVAMDITEPHVPAHLLIHLPAEAQAERGQVLFHEVYAAVLGRARQPPEISLVRKGLPH